VFNVCPDLTVVVSLLLRQVSAPQNTLISQEFTGEKAIGMTPK
jgi:hypothetical protein